MSEAFWKIVDGHGLDCIPSDEHEALLTICTRLVRAEAERAADHRRVTSALELSNAWRERAEAAEAERNRLRGALENSNALLAAMLHEKPDDAEISAQITENRTAILGRAAVDPPSRRRGFAVKDSYFTDD
ncbi:hypothetical protein [Methylobacterium sp. WSM2598]|uniref:hypothetical protein n=1 Tax=Methylobacterium sp. WSM2598 TaxID=398261 RepID=UPI000475DFA8|nr:hypothetical protein [Methylobacterium sp. WSM2598]